jgi:hypothetical protein
MITQLANRSRCDHRRDPHLTPTADDSEWLEQREYSTLTPGTCRIIQHPEMQYELRHYGSQVLLDRIVDYRSSRKRLAVLRLFRKIGCTLNRMNVYKLVPVEAMPA